MLASQLPPWCSLVPCLPHEGHPPPPMGLFCTLNGSQACPLCLSACDSGESSAYPVVLSSPLSFHLPQPWCGTCRSLAHLSSPYRCPHRPRFALCHPVTVVPLQHPSHPHFPPPALVWCPQISCMPLLSSLPSSPPSFGGALSSYVAPLRHLSPPSFRPPVFVWRLQIDSVPLLPSPPSSPPSFRPSISAGA